MTDKLCEITFQPLGITVNVPKNTTVLEAAVLNNLPLESLCNRTGTCGKCLVKASGLLSKPLPQEQVRLGTKLSGGWRMACQAKIMGKAEVILSENHLFQTVEGGRARKYVFDPVIKKLFAASGEYVLPARQLYGVAVDIGTTSMVAALIDLNSGGNEIATAACLNPQTQFGGDVITRITFAHQSGENTLKLKEAVLSGINRLIALMCTDKKIPAEEICHITVAGNTTMLHLLVGLDPISLAVAPYTPVFVDYQEWKASKLGISTAPNAVVSLLPSLSAFVGVDILAGMVAIDFHKSVVPALFIDIGTNGEIAANVNGKLVATSSAAGPALEGMNIHCGCRAETGAISGIRIGEDGEFNIETIGSAEIRGLCGSGLVELVTELVKAGVILSSGRYAQPADLPDFLASRLIDYEGQPAFLVDADSMTVLTQKDVRQVQLAKAAIAAAIEILFRRLEIELSTVKKIYIAGAFGYHLKPEALRTIGLLPPGLDAEIEFVGNTAKEGARLCLVSRTALEEIQTLQKTLVPLELSYAPDFMDNYVGQMDFPGLPGGRIWEERGLSLGRKEGYRL